MRLLEKLSVVAKQRGMAASTIQCYSLWIKQFLRFSAVAHGGWKHPSKLGTADVEAFLNDMVTARQLAGSTQNQANTPTTSCCCRLQLRQSLRRYPFHAAAYSSS